MSLELTRTAPARNKTITFNWVREFLPMSPAYRIVRSKMQRLQNTCFGCKHKFVNGEMMHAANTGTQGNKLLCTTCVGRLSKTDY